MKFLVLLLATAAISSASILGTKKVQIAEDGTIVIQGENGKQVLIKKNGPYGQKNIEIDVTGPNTLAKRIKIDNNNLVSIEKGVEYSIPINDDDYLDQRNKRSYTTDDQILNVLHTLKGDYTSNNIVGEYDVQYFYNILFKLFDTEVLRIVLEQQHVYDQVYYGQKSINGLWDIVLSQQGIFDFKVLVKIINDNVLRNFFIAQGLFDKVVLDQILYAYKTEGVYDQYLLHRLVNTQELKRFFINKGVSVHDILEKTFNNQYSGNLFKEEGIYGQDYNKYNVHYFVNALVKVFDRQVLKTILIQQNMYNQEMYGQYSDEKLWDMILANQGIFDHNALIEIINNKVLRNYFVQQGFFDKVVLDQILFAYKTEGVFDQYLLQRLVNTQVLKYFLINHGISVNDILKQISYNKYYGNTSYNKNVLGYSMLKQIISQPIYRNIMVQYGIFNKNILNQILSQYNTQGVYDMVLLRQLVNKDALYKALVQYGVVDQIVLRQYVDNESLGLNFLYKNNFFQQTPRLTYTQLIGSGNLAKYGQNTPVYPYGGNYLRNIMYGQNSYGLNRGYNKGYYGKFYSQYPTTVQQSY